MWQHGVPAEHERSWRAPLADRARPALGSDHRMSGQEYHYHDLHHAYAAQGGYAGEPSHSPREGRMYAVDGRFPERMPYSALPSYPSQTVASSSSRMAFPMKRSSAPLHSPGKSHLDHLPPSQLTPSCSRCRTKKLKCQFEERGPHAACTNCIGKGLGHECHRDLRTPRGKKGPAKAPAILAHERTSEIAALKRRLSQLEDEACGPSATLSPLKQALPPADRPAMIRTYNSSSSIDKAEPRSAQDVHVDRPTVQSPYGCDHAQSHELERTVKERDAANVLEALASAAGKHGQPVLKSVSIQAMPGGFAQDTKGRSPLIPKDRTYDGWGARKSLEKKCRLIREAKASPLMDDIDVVTQLVRIFCVRLNPTVGQVVYEPGFHRAMKQFLTMSADDLIASSWMADSACLAVLLLVLCIGWEAYPEKMPRGEPLPAGFETINAAREQGQDPAQEWFRIAREAFSIETSYQLTSIAALQAACLILARGSGEPGWLRMVQLIATNSAQDLGLHRLGRASRDMHMDTASFIRLETGVRIWNYLQLRDWCGVGLGGEGHLAYLIQPELCTTRPPLNLSDEDLEGGMCESRPMSSWTPLSFCILQNELADIVRQGMILGRTEERQAVTDGVWKDGRPWHAIAPDEMSPSNIEFLQRLISQYMGNLPEHFKLDSKAAEPRIIGLQRWQLLHELFDLSIHLSRKTIASTILVSFREDGSAHSGGTSLGTTIEPPGITCRRIARAIIAQHSELRQICPVVNSLVINYTHLYSACVVGITDLISRQLQKPTQFYSPPTRDERREIRQQLQDVIERLAALAKRPVNRHMTDTQLSTPRLDGPLTSSSAESTILDAQEHGVQILESLLAFEDEVASAPVPLYTLNGEHFDKQRRVLSEMAREMCLQASASVSTTAASLNRQKDDERPVLATEFEGYSNRMQSTTHWPAILTPPEKCRSIPQTTLLPIVGAWQPVLTSHTSAISSNRSSQVVSERKTSWPSVNDAEMSEKERLGDDDCVFVPRPSLREDDSVAMTVLEWAFAMRDPAQFAPLSASPDAHEDRNSHSVERKEFKRQRTSSQHETVPPAHLVHHENRPSYQQQAQFSFHRKEHGDWDKQISRARASTDSHFEKGDLAGKLPSVSVLMEGPAPHLDNVPHSSVYALKATTTTPYRLAPLSQRPPGSWRAAHSDLPAPLSSFDVLPIRHSGLPFQRSREA